MNSAPRLLFVEQEQQVFGLLRTVLTRAGYEFQTARTAEEAIDKMKASSGCDAVISEEALPGMDGHEVARHLAFATLAPK